MTIEHNIAKQEIELKELLNRVMAEPLQPIKDDFESQFKILEEIEEQIKELREIDLVPLQNLERLEKLGKEIKSLIEDDLSAAIKKELNELQTSQQSALEKTEENLVKHIDTVQAQVNGNTVHLTNKLQNSLNAQHGELIQLQNQNLGELNSLQKSQKSALEETQENLVTHIDTVQARANENTVQLANELQNSLNAQHGELIQLQNQNLEELNALQISQQSALEETQENLVRHIDSVQAQLNESMVNLINSLIASNEKMQTMLKMQYEQTLQLQQKNAALTIQYDKKTSQLFLSTKKWIVIATFFAGIGIIETGVVIVRHWF